MKKVGILALALIVALGSLGVAYAMWDTTLAVEATVLTGEVNAGITGAFTDDDGTPNVDTIDPGDDGGGTLYDRWGLDSSNDPLASEPVPPRGDKDVGRSTATFDPAGDPYVATVVIENGYPCYYSTAYFEITNTGTIPVKIQAVMEHLNVDHWVSWDGGSTWTFIVASTRYPVVPGTAKWIDFDAAGDVREADLSVHVTGIVFGTQIDPGESVLMDLDFHVMQGAGQGVTYVLDEEIQLVQWNEYEEPPPTP